MKYLPATAAAIVVGVAVSLGLYLTRDPDCLIGLAGLIVVWFIMPDRTVSVDD